MNFETFIYLVGLFIVGYRSQNSFFIHNTNTKKQTTQHKGNANLLTLLKVSPSIADIKMSVLLTPNGFVSIFDFYIIAGRKLSEVNSQFNDCLLHIVHSY